MVPVPCIQCEYCCKRNSEVTVHDTDIVEGPYAVLGGIMSWGKTRLLQTLQCCSQLSLKAK